MADYKEIDLLQVGNCKLTKQRCIRKGLETYWYWNMTSPKTKNHSILEKSFNKRVRTHWNGFIDNNLKTK